MDANVDVTKHILVPKHIKMSEGEVQALLEKYNISINQLPKILKSDAAIKNLNPEVGEVFKIERESITAGKSFYYRAVVHG
jgi:DNA-directed RNA polymerase subunit H